MTSPSEPDGQGQAHDDVVRTQALTKRFGDETSVDELTMHVPRGQIFGFIGPSGSGKTTTVRLLAGIYHPTSGTAEVLGRSPTDFTKDDRVRIGYLPQRPFLYAQLSIAANVRFAASLYGMRHGVRRQVDEVLEFVELASHRRKRLSQASGGMQRRVALAAALVHDPELLFLDEPTAGLDPILRDKLWSHFRQLRDQGRTLFVTTQYMGEAAYCDQVGVMIDGRLLVVDTPERLRIQAVGGEIVRATPRRPLDHSARAELMALPFVRDVRRLPGVDGLDIVVDDASTGIPALVAYFERTADGVVSIQHHLAPFDEVFVTLVGRYRQTVDAVPPG